MESTDRILETDRLYLRRFRTDDHPFILELLNSEGWMRYIGDRQIRTAEQAVEYLQNGPMKSYAKNGFGLSLVALKGEGTPIGMCGLIKRELLPHIDLGFAFLPQYTGAGYAFEIAGATLQYGFSELGLDRIVAITLPENERSIRLPEKLGFVHEGPYYTEEGVLLLYRRERADFPEGGKG